MPDTNPTFSGQNQGASFSAGSSNTPNAVPSQQFKSPPAPPMPMRPSVPPPNLPGVPGGDVVKSPITQSPPVFPRPTPVIPVPVQKPPVTIPKPIIPTPTSVPVAPVVPKPVPMPTPAVPAPASIPAIKPIPAPAGETFKSSIRTMQDDINALKKGQKPAGIQFEKATEKDTETSPLNIPVIPPSPRPVSQGSDIKLGGMEKSRILPGNSGAMPSSSSPKPSISSPITNAPSSGISIPEGPKGGGLFTFKNIIILAVVVVIIGLGAWYFLFRTSEPKVVYTPTPSLTSTPTPTATPKVLTLEDYFVLTGSVSFVPDATFGTKFSNSLKNIPAASRLGDAGLYRIYNPATKQIYGFSEFSSGIGITAPKGLLALIEDKNFYLTAMKKADGKDSYGFIVKLANLTGAKEALITWEKTMPQEFKNAFLINPAKAQLKQFSDNLYKSTAIRYMNFSTPDITIDYSIVTATNNQKYLVFTNSKEHTYIIIDKLSSVPSQ